MTPYSMTVFCVCQSEASIGCSVRSQPFSLVHRFSVAGNVSGLLDRGRHYCRSVITDS